MTPYMIVFECWSNRRCPFMHFQLTHTNEYQVTQQKLAQEQQPFQIP